MECLPPVAMDSILSYLDEASLAHLGAACFRLYAVTNCDRLWRRHCFRRGWERCCPGGVEDLALKRSVGGSNVSGTSPTFCLGDLDRNQNSNANVALPPMCPWKQAFFRAAHLEANWRLGRYSVAAILRGHAQKIAHLNDMACDGSLVVSAASDGSACVWNLRPTEKHPEPYSLLRRIEIDDAVTAVALSHHCIFLGRASGSLNIYSRSDFSLLQSISALTETIRMFRLTEDGAHLAIIREHSILAGAALIQVLDLANFEITAIFPDHTDDVTCAHLQGNCLATASWDQSIALWSLNPPMKLVKREAHSEGVLSLKLDVSLCQVVSGGADGSVAAWTFSFTAGETDLQELWRATDDDNEVYCVDFNTEVVVSGGSDSTVRVRDSFGALLHVFMGHHGTVRHLVLGPEGRLVSGGDVKMLFVWNYRQGEKLACLNRNPSIISSLWVSDTLLVIASAGSPAEVIILSFW